VFAAIKAGYARTITYYVFAAPPTSAAYRHNANDPTLVLEEYQFTIGYGDETGLDDGFARVAGVAVGGRRLGDKQRGPKTRVDDEEKIKDAGDQMLRQLEALIANLDPLPPGSKIGIRMTYVRDTPPEYEPPFFEAAAPKPEPRRNARRRRRRRRRQRQRGGLRASRHAVPHHDVAVEGQAASSSLWRR